VQGVVATQTYRTLFDRKTRKIIQYRYGFVAPKSSVPLASVSALRLCQSASVEVAVPKFLENGRPEEAVSHLSANRKRPDTSKLIQVVLTALARSPETTVTPSAMLSYEIGTLLDQLVRDEVDESAIAHFEFAFFSLLQYERTASALFRRLSESPSMFVELVQNFCHEENANPETRPEATQEELALARISYDVLREWRSLPGTQTDGTVDAAYLASWVREAREHLVRVDRVDMGDKCIVQLLSGASKGADGIWPTEAVRDIVESLNSDHLRDGLEIGKLNARGVTTRGMLDGGVQEVVLASQYEQNAKKIATRWPTVARVLRNLSNHYRESAAREDFQMQRYRDMRA
jgi:hypothetical protein